MGYTHYWDIVPHDPEGWEALQVLARRIVRTAVARGIKISYEEGDERAPEINAKRIRLNGFDEGHETFLLRPSYSGFCKTNQKPYDAVVVAILSTAGQTLPGFGWRSDGENEDGDFDDAKRLLVDSGINVFTHPGGAE